jgi:hypothetical protein
VIDGNIQCGYAICRRRYCGTLYLFEQGTGKLFRTLVKELIKTGKPPDQGRTDELNIPMSRLLIKSMDGNIWSSSGMACCGMMIRAPLLSLNFQAIGIHMVSNDVREEIVPQFPPRMFNQYGSTSELSL